ncbi:MAG: CoA transferase, partial [Clostridia bacterium]|nr:CoA transferase [Clostridia bacterium]
MELGAWVAAPFCARVLADLGADVVKVEPAGEGDPLRGYPPQPPCRDGAAAEPAGALFLALNTGKRSVALPRPGAGSGRGLLD